MTHERTPLAIRSVRVRERARAGRAVLAVEADVAALVAALRSRGALADHDTPTRAELAHFAALLLAEVTHNPETPECPTAVPGQPAGRAELDSPRARRAPTLSRHTP
jgi:hypothetical protein